MAILETVKRAARIKHNSLDPDIERLVTWARSEMERVGVPSAVAASEDNPLITECVIQGVLKNISNDKDIRDAADKSFSYQLDNLRKHIWEEDEDDS